MSKPGTVLRDESLDARLCAEVGAELRRVRGARGLTIAQVGEKLLLSARQVRALEEVEFAAFHNPTFHLNALKKYAALAELDAAWLNRLNAAGARPEAPAAQEEGGASPRDGTRRWPVFVGLAAIAIVAIAAVWYGLRTRHVSLDATPRKAAEARPAPATGSPATPSTLASAGIVSPVAPLDGAAKGPTAFGALKALRPTWVLLRDAENTTIQRSLAAGESLELESQPNYLAAGAADLELTIGGVAVDVSRFAANGGLRIGAGDFDALVQGASPIPAPTPAAAR
jgi:cytoskeleton protein RodZ